MDTEFPGIIYGRENNAQFRNLTNYQLTKLNVDALKVIQIGITLADKSGFYPEDTCTWQFNLKFDINNDLYQQSSIQLLNSSGIDFESHNTNGINYLEFGEYLISSGLILNPEVFWVTFHGIYDFAYLLKVLKNLKLPETEKEFYDDLDLYFGNYFDIRYLIQFSDYSKGSLQKLATECNIQRIGIQHQAGSDSVVTLMAFFRLVQEVFVTTPVTNYKNILFHYIEKDDVEFDANKLYYNHMNPFSRPNMMYMYPYYNNLTGMSGIPGNNNMMGMNNMIPNYQGINNLNDEKK
jgi:CCR4-NOT transcription complex subunit 7/8